MRSAYIKAIGQAARLASASSAGLTRQQTLDVLVEHLKKVAVEAAQPGRLSTMRQAKLMAAR